MSRAFGAKMQNLFTNQKPEDAYNTDLHELK